MFRKDKLILGGNQVGNDKVEKAVYQDIKRRRILEFSRLGTVLLAILGLIFYQLRYIVVPDIFGLFAVCLGIFSLKLEKEVKSK